MKSKRNIPVLLALGLTSAVLLQLVAGCGFGEKLKEEEQILSSFQFNHSSFQHLQDGEYIGECVLPLKSARVRVIVRQGVVQQIDLLEHSHGPGKSGEGVIPAVIEKQSLGVDAISGATKSSLAVLKAIENAISPKS